MDCNCLENNVLLTLVSCIFKLCSFSNKHNLYEAALVERVAEQSIVLMKNNRVSPSRLYDAEKFLHDNFSICYILLVDSKLTFFELT